MTKEKFEAIRTWGKCECCGWVGEVEEAEWDFKNARDQGHHFLRALVCVDASECLKRTSIEHLYYHTLDNLQGEQPDMVSSG